MPAFGVGTRPWKRGTTSNIAASTAILGSGELLVDDAGGVYGGDGLTQIKLLGRLARVAEIATAIAAQAATDAAAYATKAAVSASLAGKADLVGGTVPIGQLPTTAIAQSPALTGAFTSPSQVNSQIQAVVGAAPVALSTLQAIDAQLANDESAAAALTTQVSGLSTSLTTLQGQVTTNTTAIAAIYDGGVV